MLLPLTANRYVPTSARTGNGELALFRATNGFIRGRDKPYFEVYKGSLDLGENLAAVAITGNITYTSSSTTVSYSGSGTATRFLDELHRGQKILTASRHIIVVEEVVDNSNFIAAAKPAGNGTNVAAYRLWRLFEIDKKRGSLLSGNALEFDKGTILCVGSGDLHINGSTLTNNLAADRHPQIGILDTGGTYTIQSLGFKTVPNGITTSDVAGPSAQTVTRGGDTLTTGAPHGLVTGSEFKLTTTATALPAPLQTNTTYFAIVTGGSTLKVAASLSDAILGIFITLIDGGTGVGTHTETPVSKNMPIADRSIRIARASTKLGTPSYGNPGPKIKQNIATAGHVIQISFPAMDTTIDTQDAWRIYASEYGGSLATATANADNGPWYHVRTVTSAELGGTGAATYNLEYLDAEINASSRLATFDNDYPQDAEFVGTVAGYPVLVSCQGKPDTSHPAGTSPGSSLVPFKVSNIAAAPLILDNGSRNEVPLSPPEIIIGQYMAAGRLYLMTANTLQIAVFTADADFPVATRPFWKSGFKNPDALCFVNGRLYGFTSAGAMRSVADGEEGSEEHAFAADVEELMKTWDASRVSVIHDPQNECVCYVFSGNNLNKNGKYTSIILPFMLRTESWGPEIVLSSTTDDMIISGVATVNGHFEFIAGGTSQKTYRFDTYSDVFGNSFTFVSAAVNPGTGNINKIVHGLMSGQPVYLTTSGTLPLGLVANTTYYVILVDADNFKLATTYANSQAGTAITGGTSGTGTQTVHYGDTIPWSIAWQFTDGGVENKPKKVKHLRITGKLSSANFGIHGAASGENIDVTELEAGNLGSKTGSLSLSNATGLEYYPSEDFQARDLMCFTASIVGTWNGADVNNLDRVDECVIEYTVSGGRR
jgi:hypothetical protein